MILALDASTKSTGYAIFENKKLIKSGCITASSTDLIKRIQKITKVLDEEILSQYDIDTLVIEEVRPDNNISTAKTQKALMYLQASFAFLLHDKYPKIIIEYTYPSQWRSKCGIHTGRGVKRETLKQADINFAESQYNLKGINDDEADAICIGTYYLIKDTQDNDHAW